MRVQQHLYLFAVFGCLSAVTSVAVTTTHVVHEYAAESSKEWAKVGGLKNQDVMPVSIALQQQNLQNGHDMLIDISDPQSPRYGNAYTEDQLIALFAPHEDSIEAVSSWLESEGISRTRHSGSSNKQWIKFDATVAELEKLLHTKYHIYEHQASGMQRLGADDYSIPQYLQAHVDFITPAANKLQLRGYGDGKSGKGRQKSKRAKGQAKLKTHFNSSAECWEITLPHCLADLYGLSIPYTGPTAAGNALGLFQAAQPWSPRALRQYFQGVTPWIPPDTQPIRHLIDGALDTAFPHDGTNSIEPSFDLEVSYPIVYPQEVVLWNTDDHHAYSPVTSHTLGMYNTFLDALDGSYCNRTAFGETGDDPKYDPVYPDDHGWNHTRMCGRFHPTNVISSSYSWGEIDRPVYYERRQCAEWMKLGLQRITVIGATGDSGVAGSNPFNGRSCLERDGHKGIFAPYAHAACPYVLGAGSTQLVKDECNKELGREVATSFFGSGGGFSNYFPAPEWQKGAVDRYFTENPSPYPFYETKWNENVGANGGIFNRAGRGFPDVSAIGDKLPWNIAGNGPGTNKTRGDGGGTSASAPMFASIITRINEERLRVGKSPVGFVAPALYANPQLLNDITEGNNPGCKTSGFNASKGWDPVTGLGSPNYPKMLEFFMGLR